MTRALSIGCLALVMLAIGASTALAGKPSIAILGLEVIDASGAPSTQDTTVAKELTEGLRSRAKAGTTPYGLAPGSDKELVDEKLLKTCDNEAAACMAAIGNELGADFLMYGHIEKQGKAYQVTMKLLDVHKKMTLRSTPGDMIPLSEASGAPLQGWAKKIYATLVGQSECVVTVRTTPAIERGTVLIDGVEKATITSGKTELTLPDGKYKLAIDAKDYRRFETSVTCSGGQAQNVPAELEKAAGGATPTGPTGPTEGTGPGGDGNLVISREGTTSGGGGGGPWKAIGFGALAGAAIAGGVWAYAFFEDVRPFKNSDVVIYDAQMKPYQLGAGDSWTNDKCSVSTYLPGRDTANIPSSGGPTAGQKSNGDFDKACTGSKITYIAAPVTIALGAVAIGSLALAYLRGHDHGHSEHANAANGHRKTKPAFALIPVMSPDGGGATFRMEW